MADCNCCSFLRTALVLTLTALVLISIGVFNNGWWDDSAGNRYPIVTVVSCENGVCVKSGGKNEAWIIFAQVSGIVSVVLTGFSLLTQAVAMAMKRRILHVINIATMSCTILLTLLHTFVVMSAFYAISLKPSMTKTSLRYRTLPMGLVATGGCVCLPAVACLFIHLIKERRESQKQKRNKSMINRVI